MGVRTIAGVAAFLLPTLFNVLLYVDGLSDGAFNAVYYITLVFAFLGLISTGVLLHVSGMFSRKVWWQLVRLDALSIFALSFTTFQLIKIHTQLHVFYEEEDTLFTTQQVIVDTTRRFIITITFVALLPYIYYAHHEHIHGQQTHFHHKQEKDELNARLRFSRESFLASMICGFGLSETLNLLLYPSIGFEDYIVLEENTTNQSLWLVYGLIRPLAIVYLLDGSTCIAPGLRNAPRIIITPRFVPGNLKSNNPSMGVALMGVIWFGMMLLGHFGIVAQLYTVVFALVESIIAIIALLFLLVKFVWPATGGLRNLLPLRQYDRFTVVLFVAALGAVAAFMTWIIMIKESLLEDDETDSNSLEKHEDGSRSAFSGFVKWFQTLFVFYICDVLLHFILLFCIYNARQKQQSYCAHNVLYIISCMLVIHNLALWAVSTDYEVVLTVELQHYSARIMEGLWPLVVEFRMLCVSMLLLSISHLPGKNTGFFSKRKKQMSLQKRNKNEKHIHSMEVASSLQTTLLSDSYTTNTISHEYQSNDSETQSENSPAQQAMTPTDSQSDDSEEEDEHELYALPRARSTISFAYVVPKPWFFIMFVIGFVSICVVTIPTAGNSPPPLPSNVSLFRRENVPLNDFRWTFSQDYNASANFKEFLARQNNVREDYRWSLILSSQHRMLVRSETEQQPEVVSDAVDNGSQTATTQQLLFAVLRLLSFTTILCMTMRLLYVTCRPFLRTLALPVRAHAMYVLSACSFVYNADMLLVFTPGISEYTRMYSKSVLITEALTAAINVLLLLSAMIYALYVSQPLAHLSGDAYFSMRYCFTVSQWLQRYLLAGFLVGSGTLELFYASFDSYRVLFYAKSVFSNHRIIFLGILRFSLIFNSFHIALLLLPLKMMASSTSIAMNPQYARLTSNIISGRLVMNGQELESNEEYDLPEIIQEPNSTDSSDTEDDPDDSFEPDPVLLIPRKSVSLTSRGSFHLPPEKRALSLKTDMVSACPTQRPRLWTSSSIALDRTDDSTVRVVVKEEPWKRPNQEKTDKKSLTPANMQSSIDIVPMFVLLPIIVFISYIFAIVFGAKKTSLYTATAWFIVSLVNISLQLVIFSRWLCFDGRFFKLKHWPEVLNKRMWRYNVSIWVVFILILLGWIQMILIQSEETSPFVTFTEFFRRIDISIAAVIIIHLYSLRKKRQRAIIFGNRLYAMMLIVAASHLTIGLTDIDKYVHFNSPGIVHVSHQHSWLVGVLVFLSF